MSEIAIASGGKTDILGIDQYDSYFNEGDRGRIRLNFTTSITQGLVNSIESELRTRGVSGATVSQSGNNLDIFFRKGNPALAIIIAVIIALIVTLIIILVSWHIFKEVVPEDLQGTVGTVAIVCLALLAGVVAWKKFRG